ncbi:hypothetical protein CGU37_20175 [Pseudomonas fluorescens]|nr:hypothetical protein CGU36_22165 [Pseudomonas fluorescens]OZO47310.1 hypothetical protein CGU37_20175 [Pseudomonas fluorescens]
MCGCGERACPALGREAAPLQTLQWVRQKQSPGFRAASQPSAGQACSPQRVGGMHRCGYACECGCGERACPALGREAAPNPGTSVYQINHIVWSGAASQPTASPFTTTQSEVAHDSEPNPIPACLRVDIVAVARA